ncbi:MAG: hypothetical protein M0D53_05535 [Flavobacterium sp. JAD_PAG50586_2]|nr:MAG: hypothetical protein M0D53_05535 [Flavobacterium sp. JAD_PAG50586_2]
MMESSQYHFNIYNSIVLGGIIQGLIFGVVVATSKKYRDTSTLLLAVLILVFSLNNLQYYLWSTGLMDEAFGYEVVWTHGQLIMGALFYLYGLKLLYPEKAIPKKTIILLCTPFVLGTIAITYLKISQSFAEHSMDFYLLEAFLEFTSIAFTMIVVVSLFFETRKAQNAAKGLGFDKVLPKLQWFRNIHIAFFVICLAWLTIITMMVTSGVQDWAFNIIWISLSVMIYWMGHVGIYKYGIMEERKKIRNHTHERSSIIDLSDKSKSEHLVAFENLLIEKNISSTLNSL